MCWAISPAFTTFSTSFPQNYNTLKIHKIQILYVWITPHKPHTIKYKIKIHISEDKKIHPVNTQFKNETPHGVVMSAAY